ncbi:hypothetical protein [Bacillus infantis]|uniref:Uncharacterized protein n=1 Tax=Bacillus infantis TaxID=324767 RepID=A0A5D4RKQ6_9BACI|nr:hypothetical protein [Bacillus infantis]TYS51933.1 hypothetical protein FZD51_00325 [Bacillus infantis]
MGVFGWIFLWGLPALLLWSTVLAAIHAKRAGSEGRFLGRTLTFISAIYEYTINSFLTWLSLIFLVFGFFAIKEGSIWGFLFMTGTGGLMLYLSFPRLKMPE